MLSKDQTIVQNVSIIHNNLDFCVENDKFTCYTFIHFNEKGRKFIFVGPR